jgi:WD40 repeat protein
MQGIRSVAMLRNGTLLASASGESDQPGELKLWDLNTGQQIAALSGHTSAINSIAFTPDGTTLASASDDGTVRLWNVAARTEIRKLAARPTRCMSLAFTSDGRTLGVRCPDGIDLWDMTTVTFKAKITAEVNRLAFLAFSPDSNFVISGVSDGQMTDRVQVWRLPRNGEPPQFAGQILVTNPHGKEDYDMFEFSSAAFAPDGRLLACGNGTSILNRGNVRLWEFANAVAEPGKKPELAKPNGNIPVVQEP